MSEFDGNLNILFISSDKYPPIRPAARVIFQEEFVKRGHRVDWLVQAKDQDTTPKRKVIGKGYAYIASTNNGISRWARLKKHLADILNDLRMFQLVRKNRYNVIQVKDKYLSAIPALCVAKLFNIKFFYWLAFPHSEASIHQARSQFARYRYFSWFKGLFCKYLLYRVILPGSNHIFVQSEQMKRDIIKEGIPGEKMIPIPGSVDLNSIPYDPVAGLARPNSTLTTPEEIKIVYLGTLNRMRRLSIIFTAFKQALNYLPNARLYILGEGDTPGDETYLKELVHELGINDAVTFTGFLPMDQAWDYIKEANVCLSPYYPTPILLSTSPTKLIEYMAMGKAVIGNEHPEQKQVIEESGAGICVPWNENAFAEAIIEICSNSERAQEMGKRGRLYVEINRTNKVVADLVEDTYIKIIGSDRNSW